VTPDYFPIGSIVIGGNGHSPSVWTEHESEVIGYDFGNGVISYTPPQRDGDFAGYRVKNHYIGDVATMLPRFAVLIRLPVEKVDKKVERTDIVLSWD
jgi:hypothetical protein